MHACEASLADHLDEVIDAGRTPDLEVARIAIAPAAASRIPMISIATPDPAIYDGLLQAGALPAEPIRVNEDALP